MTPATAPRPPLAEAGRIPSSTGAGPALAPGLLDALSHPAIVVDRTRRIVAGNAAARDALRAMRYCVDDGGVFRCAFGSDTRALDELLGAGPEPTPRRAMRIRRADRGAPVVAVVHRLGDAPGHDAGAGRPERLALLVFHDPSATEALDAGILRAAFGLSETESRVAVALATGATPKQIAWATETSVSTVRTHLRTIYSKVGIGRQADLVRRVLALAVVGAPAPDGRAPLAQGRA